MNRILIAVIVALTLAGCAYTPAGMEQPQNAHTFTVDQPYQLTLKNIVEADQGCQDLQLVPIGQRINDVQHYPDLREAKITQGASGIGRQIYQVIHVREVGEGTEVTLYIKLHARARLEQLQRWALGDKEC